jgi:hypothetical protein
VVIHLRGISGGVVTVQKELNGLRLESVMRDIEHLEGIPPALQRITHRGKAVTEASFAEVFGFASDGEEVGFASDADQGWSVLEGTGTYIRCSPATSKPGIHLRYPSLTFRNADLCGPCAPCLSWKV